MRLNLLIALIMIVVSTQVTMAQNTQVDDLVNLEHLRFLTEPVTIDGQDMALVHIYSEHPEYEWVDASGEGISAIDDVARAAIVYLWQYERTQDPELLELARLTLNFVMYMQAEDGEFYNFVYDREGTINEQGNTSYKSLGWWAMRGLWALGEGVRVFDRVDPEYAGKLVEAYLRTESALGATLSTEYATMSVHGFEQPAWIPGGEPAVASIGVLGMSAYYRARPNPTTAEYITLIANGIAQSRLGDHHTYPFGLHPIRSNAPGYWHTWGAHMTHALVEAGIALERQDWIDSAAESANSFLLRQLAFERFRYIGVIPDRLGQIAYGTNMLVQTYMALYRATGEERYAHYGGLAASWYWGNNMAGEQMYFPETGRVYDGINGPTAWRVNRNSGAESTIEGLMSIIAIADTPPAMAQISLQTVTRNSYLILQAEDGQRVVGTPTYYHGDWTGEGHISAGRYVGLGEGQRMRLQFEVEQADDYLLYVAHMRQPVHSNTNTIQRTATPPIIDGNLDDWADDLPVLSSNTKQQFLRGAGVWQGAAVDSHHITLMWDQAYLYIRAEVRDPEHHQPYTLSTAWQGDTLWFYFTNKPDASMLSAKFTLAQTPDGPQVWDWVHSRFLEGATMAFVPGDGGYIYEAAVPWHSLDIEGVEAGMRFGIEAGRGIGGNSFMDLTGRDPDVAANLMQVMLVEPGDANQDIIVPQVSLELRLDDLPASTILQTVSPDNEHFWLDLAMPAPIHLEPGEHILRYRNASTGESTMPALSKIDAFYLQPVTARHVLAYPDGRLVILTYDTLTGKANWITEPQ